MINEYYVLNLYKGTGNSFNTDGTVNPAGGPADGMIRTEENMKWLKAMMTAGYQFYPKQGVGKDKSGMATSSTMTSTVTAYMVTMTIAPFRDTPEHRSITSASR